MEVVLLGAAILEADLAQRGRCDTHDDRALHLGAHTIGIDGGAAIDGDIHARDREVALVVDGDLDHGGDVAHEAVVRRDTQAAAFPHRLAPARFARDRFGYSAQASGVDGIALGRLAVVPGIAQHLRGDDARRTDDVPST